MIISLKNLEKIKYLDELIKTSIPSLAVIRWISFFLTSNEERMGHQKLAFVLIKQPIVAIEQMDAGKISLKTLH